MMLMARPGSTRRSRHPTPDPYALIQGRDAWRREQAAELQAIIDGTGTPAYGAALMKREEAWQKRGEQQSQAWRTAQRRQAMRPQPAFLNRTHLSPTLRRHVKRRGNDVVSDRPTPGVKRRSCAMDLSHVPGFISAKLASFSDARATAAVSAEQLSGEISSS